MHLLKKIFAIFLIAAALNIHAEEKNFYGISPYKDNYFITGSGKDQVKSQISFKYHAVNFDYLNIYLGYSQQLFWNAYNGDNSSPMYDINFNPELFLRQNINFIPSFKYLQLTPWEHKSNGQPSNNIDRTQNSYGAALVNYFDLKYINITTTSKIFTLYAVSENTRDLYKYISFSEFKFDFDPTFTHNKFVNIDFSLRLVGGLVNAYGAREYNIKIKPQSDNIRINLLIQIWEGYGQNQIDYNIYDKAYRFGIVLN